MQKERETRIKQHHSLIIYKPIPLLLDHPAHFPRDLSSGDHCASRKQVASNWLLIEEATVCSVPWQPARMKSPCSWNCRGCLVSVYLTLRGVGLSFQRTNGLFSWPCLLMGSNSFRTQDLGTMEWVDFMRKAGPFPPNPSCLIEVLKF